MEHIVDISARPVELPLKETFETAQRRADTSPTVFVELSLSGGGTALGEATPVKYVTGEDQDSVVTAVEQLKEVVVGREPGEYRLIAREMREMAPGAHSARNSVEIAVLDALGKICGVPVYSIFGGCKARMETDVTIPVVPPAHAKELAERAYANGFILIKVKVGGKDYDADMERTLAIASVSPEIQLVTDANQGFTPDQAVAFVDEMTARGIGIKLMEQPVACEDIDGLKWVTDHTDIPVFADEAAKSPEDVLNLVNRKAVDGINVKLMKAGVVGALDIVSICRAGGVKLMLGCMLESSIGLSASLHVACGTGAFMHLDLDGDQLIAGRPVQGGFIREGGFMEPLDLPGFGCWRERTA